MRKIPVLSLMLMLAFIISSCGVGGSSGTDEVSVSGYIDTTGGDISTTSLRVGSVSIGYISAISIEKGKKTKFTYSEVKDDGSFKLKLKKKRKYAFVLYDEDGNPVIGIRKDGFNAFKFNDDSVLDIVLDDNDNDGRPDIVDVQVSSGDVDMEYDSEFSDDDGDNIPDVGESSNLNSNDNHNDNDNDNENSNSNSNDNMNYNDNGNSNSNSNSNSNYNGNNNGNNNGNSNGNNNGNNGGNNGNVGSTSDYTVIAWNDLGMHCMDADYSVFSILPPYNTLVAQVVKKGHEPDKLNDGDVEITYEPLQDPDTNYTNTYSAGKTNFWDFVQALFNVSLQPNEGLKGKKWVSTPQPMDYDNHWKWFIAEGIPITPYTDEGVKYFYPLVKVVAKDKNGNVLATTRTVLPVSDEMTCIECHGSNSGYSETEPSTGWENDPNPEKDYRWNILKLHDDKHDISAYLSDLQAKGYNYQPSLYQTAKSGTPVFCAACHKSNALPGSGIAGIPPLTQAIHSKHANAIDPETGLRLNDISNRGSCYKCHPGKQTQCLRGAMGSAEIQCQNCHGGMNVVGKAGREGWFDMPTCQACHYNGKRELTALVNGQFREPADKTFATNDNVPMTGYKLYRFSKGHGGIKCEACHGSTHAIYPSSHHGDNLQSEDLQGYAGTIRECFVCHGNNVPLTANKGPHGMHTIGQRWVDKHGDYAEDGRYRSCAKCHGSDYRGSFLSEVKTTKTFRTEWGTKTFQAGHQVSCYDCHNGPRGDD